MSADTFSSDGTEMASMATRTAQRGGTLVASGILVGLGALALARGLHLYVHFYSYASGIATSRLLAALSWSLAGGILLTVGIAMLLGSVLDAR